MTDDFLDFVLANDLYVMRVTRTASKNTTSGSYFQCYDTVDNLVTYWSCYAEKLKSGLIAMDESLVSRVQKPKLDFDAKADEFKDVSEDFSTGSHIKVIRDVIKCFSYAIGVMFKLDSTRTVLPGIDVYSACRNNKISFHLVYPMLCCSLEDCMEIASRTAIILDGWRTDVNLSRYIDLGVYSPKQGFRVMGSCKFLEMNNPDPDPEQQVVTVVKKHVLIVDKKKLVQVECEDKEEQLLKSLIAWVDDIPFMNEGVKYPMTGEKSRKAANRSYRASLAQKDSSLVPHASTSSSSSSSSSSLQILLEHIARKMYNANLKCRTNPSVTGGNSSIFLDRKTKGFCVQCKREHETENVQAYIVIDTDPVTTRNSKAKPPTQNVMRYKLSFLCLRYRKNSSYKFKPAGTITLRDGKWSQHP